MTVHHHEGSTIGTELFSNGWEVEYHLNGGVDFHTQEEYDVRQAYAMKDGNIRFLWSLENGTLYFINRVQGVDGWVADVKLRIPDEVRNFAHRVIFEE